MRTVLVYLVFECLFFVSFPSINANLLQYPDDPDMYRNVSQLITSKGYPVEDHLVQTDDGYLLSVQHIPHGRRHVRNGRRGDGGKPAVFIQHGLLLSANDWVMNFPRQSLGFILADHGYDVWLGNSRGNTYSRGHIKYTTDDAEFWNFSFDEVAQYDLPAFIDYILKKTGQKQLFYIGHSQGTTALFALLSQSPEYNEKIKLFIALAPVTTVGFSTSALSLLAPSAAALDLLDRTLGSKEFLPNDALIKFLSENVCNTPADLLCANVGFLINGIDPQQLNMTRQGVYSSHTPAGTSTKSVVHYAQLVLNKRFAKFDYGLENFYYYKTVTPPEYDATKITAPVALLWGQNDALADPTDVHLLKPKIRNLASFYKVPFPAWAHYDFCIGLQANTLVYREVLRLLRQYQ